MNRLFAVAATLALTLTACPPSIDTGDGGDGPISVGPKGGIFVRNGWGISIPEGALTEDTVITVTQIDTGVPEVSMRKRISYGFRFSPTSLTFRTPATIYLPWLDDRVPEAVDPNTFDLRRQAGSEAFAQLPGTKTDTTPFRAVEGQTDRLGLFWVTSPSEPNIDRIEIDPPSATLSVGGTQQFTAKVVSPSGQSVDVSVSWGMVPARVGTISGTGLFTAKDPGVATVTARAGSMAATAKVSIPGTTRGPTTFVHQNPFPTGNDLYAALYAPAGLGTLYAGDNGTVLAKDAAGTWTRLFSTPGVTLTAVGGTTPTNAVAIGRSGTSGVLVQFNGTTTPTFAVYPPTSISDLVALWFDGTSGMGVGSGNNVVIRRNGVWTTEYHPSFEKLLSVIGDGAGGFVVVGDLGSLYRWDPVRTVWDSLYDRRLAVKLDAAQLVDVATGEAWAVGGNKLWHFLSGGWTAENLPPTPVLEQTTAIGVIDGHIVVGGQVPVPAMTPPAALGQIVVRTASTDPVPVISWAAVSMRSLQVPRGIFGSGARGSVVGDFGAIWTWDSAAKTFTEESRGFYGNVADLAVTASDVFAAVNECKTVACTSRVGRVMHSTGAGQWAELGTFPVMDTVTAVAAKSATEVVVATQVSGVFRWDGSSWVTLPVMSAQGAVLDLQYCGVSLWGCGENGGVYKGNATLLANVGSVAAGQPVTALSCPSENEIWVAGPGFLIARQGTGDWAPKTNDKVTQRGWKAVWAPGGGEGFAFGDARYGVYYDSVTLSAVEALGGIQPAAVSAMWGSTIDNLYLVGLAKAPLTSGFALRFDGVTWTLVDSGSQRKATAVNGSSPTNVWVGTEGGGVLQAGAVPAQ